MKLWLLSTFLFLIQFFNCQAVTNNSINLELYQSQVSSLLQGYIKYYYSDSQINKLKDRNLTILVTSLELSKIKAVIFPIDPNSSNITFSNQFITPSISGIKIKVTADILVNAVLTKMKANMTCEILINKFQFDLQFLSVNNSLQINFKNLFIDIPLWNIKLSFYSENPKTQNLLEQLTLPFIAVIISEIYNEFNTNSMQKIQKLNEFFSTKLFIDYPFQLFNATFYVNVSIPSSPVLTTEKIQMGFYIYFHLQGEKIELNPHSIPKHSDSCGKSIQIFVSYFLLNSFLLALSKSNHIYYNFCYQIFASPINITCTNFSNGFSNFTQFGIMLNVSTSCSFYGGPGDFHLPIKFNNSLQLTVAEQIINNSVELNIVSTAFDHVNIIRDESTFDVSDSWMQSMLEFTFGNMADLFNENTTKKNLKIPGSDILDYNRLSQNSKKGYYQMCGDISFKNSKILNSILVQE